MIVMYPDEPLVENAKLPSVYLIGSYSLIGHAGWRVTAARKLRDHVGNVFFTSVNMASFLKDQLSQFYRWTARWMLTADVVGFWIDNEADTGFDLFELGLCIGRNRPVVIGVDERRQHFSTIQVRLEFLFGALGFDEPVFGDMTDWVAAIKAKLPKKGDR